MPDLSKRIRTAGCAALIGMLLASCGSAPEHRPEQAGDAASPSASTAAVSLPKIQQDDRTAGEPSSLPFSSLGPEQQVPDSSAVGIANASPDPEDGQAAAKEAPFNPKKPELAGVELGSSEAAVRNKLGSPVGTFELPSDPMTVSMWEYEGMTVGFDESGEAVYVEVSSSEVATGVLNLAVGSNAEQAAHEIGVTALDDSNVLSSDVAGGTLKMDLDSSTRAVVSIKLISGV